METRSQVGLTGSLLGNMAENGFIVALDRLSDKVETGAKNNKQAEDHKSKVLLVGEQIIYLDDDICMEPGRCHREDKKVNHAHELQN